MSLNLDEFTAPVERELQLQGAPFARADLLAFADSVWPVAPENLDAARWLRVFAGATATAPDSPAPIGRRMLPSCAFLWPRAAPAAVRPGGGDADCVSQRSPPYDQPLPPEDRGIHPA